MDSCTKVELYSQLDEQQANEMMAILLAEEIACNKAAGEEATWKLEVSQADFSKAVNRLRQKGYPKARYTAWVTYLENPSRLFTDRRAYPLYACAFPRTEPNHIADRRSHLGSRPHCASKQQSLRRYNPAQ